VLPTDSVVWVARIPDQNFDVNPSAGRASLDVTNLPVFDWTTNPNSFLNERVGLPKIPATVSFRIRWSGVTRRVNIRNEAEGFAGEFVEVTSTIEWSATNQNGFRFVSDAANTSRLLFAEVGHERNGAFFPAGG
jgi:hypothetical protein